MIGNPSGFSQRNEGFSLIEMLVVLAIISMSLFAISAFSNSPKSPQHTRLVAEQLQRFLSMARARAIASRGDVQVEFHFDARIVKSQTLKRMDIVWPDDLRVSVVSAEELLFQNSIPRFLFFADGSSSGGKVTLSKKNQPGIEVLLNWKTGLAKLSGDLDG